MSDLLVQQNNTDLSEKDMKSIEAFKASGLPGLAALKDEDFQRMTELYMGGTTYWQIAHALNITRSLVIYVSYKYGWYPAKQEYLVELQEKIKARVIHSKLASQDFILLLIQAYQKKIGAKLTKYLATNDPVHAEQINLKEIDKLLKAVDMLQALSTDPKSSNGRNPAVGLNVGDGVTIERSGDNAVTITPKPIDKTLSAMLKKWGDERRTEQNKNSKSDDDEPKPKEEPKNE